VGKVIAGMTMSLDGFVADVGGNVDRLYADFADLREIPYMTATIAETGAVIMGRKTFEMGDPDSYVGEYEFQVPIFVLTHHPPGFHRSRTTVSPSRLCRTGSLRQSRRRGPRPETRRCRRSEAST
jgi:dihydrofolate reductase